MEHIISILVENKFGVLARVAGLFSARGYNIESLSVAPTLDPTTSMITIVTAGDDRIIEQIMKQLNKVVEVLKVVDLTETHFLDRETAPFGLTFATEFHGHRVDETTAEAVRSFGTEFRLAFDRELVGDLRLPRPTGAPPRQLHGRRRIY